MRLPGCRAKWMARVWPAVLASTVALGQALPAAAQSLANRPIRLVLPYSTGGPTDLSARLLAEAIGPLLDRQVIVENRPGASGKIAAEIVARADPDGHTLMYGGSTQYVMLPLLDKTVNFKPFEDFRMVSIYTKYDIVFMTGAQTGIRSMKDLLARMRNPAEDTVYASIGQPELTPTGLAYLVFGKMYEGKARAVNYPGQAPGTVDLLAGRVHFATYTLTGALPHIRSGKLLALAVASPQRLSQLPDVPTVAEAGIPGYTAAAWYGLFAPARTAAPVIAKLQAEVAAILQQPDVRKRMTDLGATPIGSKPSEFREFQRSEMKRWKEVVDSAAIRME